MDIFKALIAGVVLIGMATAVLLPDRQTGPVIGAATRAHGSIARHPVNDASDRDAAEQLLYRIVIKPQDNAITRYLYRPVSFPLTRLLVWTPITLMPEHHETTASLWRIETSEDRDQRASMAPLRLCVADSRDQDHQKVRFNEL